jgi:hypothetical protein
MNVLSSGLVLKLDAPMNIEDMPRLFPDAVMRGTDNLIFNTPGTVITNIWHLNSKKVGFSYTDPDGVVYNRTHLNLVGLVGGWFHEMKWTGRLWMGGGNFCRAPSLLEIDSENRCMTFVDGLTYGIQVDFEDGSTWFVADLLAHVEKYCGLKTLDQRGSLLVVAP